MLINFILMIVAFIVSQFLFIGIGKLYRHLNAKYHYCKRSRRVKTSTNSDPF